MFKKSIIFLCISLCVGTINGFVKVRPIIIKKSPKIALRRFYQKPQQKKNIDFKNKFLSSWSILRKHFISLFNKKRINLTLQPIQHNTVELVTISIDVSKPIKEIREYIESIFKNINQSILKKSFTLSFLTNAGVSYIVDMPYKDTMRSYTEIQRNLTKFMFKYRPLFEQYINETKQENGLKNIKGPALYYLQLEFELENCFYNQEF